MSLIEKILLGVSVAVSWLFVALVWSLLGTVPDLTGALLELSGGILLWLTPFALLTLFSKKLPPPLIAFTLGSVAFLALMQTFYMGVGIIFLILGFVYWFLNVRYTQKMSTEFSALAVFNGISLFFTVVALFGGIIYYSWPHSAGQLSAPRIPESFFDVVYAPIASVFFSSIPGIPQNEPLNPQAARPAIYSLMNAAIARAAAQYQDYLPFLFAGGIFFLLRAILFPLSYILYGVVYLLIEIFLRLGWLQRQTIQVSKEIVSF